MIGTENDLLGVCKAYHARGDDLCATIAALDLVAAGSLAAADLEHKADTLLSQWQALRHVVVATPATHLPGLRAKLGVLCALHEQLGDLPGTCVRADLARSLLADALQITS